MATIKTDIPITGMTCAACANRIERGLNRMDGVTSANVNFATEKAVVAFESSSLSHNDIQDKIRSLGFDVLTEELSFQISGMTCATCSATVEKGLTAMQGVHTASVNLALEVGRVHYDPTKLSPTDFLIQIKKMGYDADIGGDMSENKEDHRQVAIRKMTRMFIISAIYRSLSYGRCFRTFPLRRGCTSLSSFSIRMYNGRWQLLFNFGLAGLFTKDLILHFGTEVQIWTYSSHLVRLLHISIVCI